MTEQLNSHIHGCNSVQAKHRTSWSPRGENPVCLFTGYCFLVSFLALGNHSYIIFSVTIVFYFFPKSQLNKDDRVCAFVFCFINSFGIFWNLYTPVDELILFSLFILSGILWHGYTMICPFIYCWEFEGFFFFFQFGLQTCEYSCYEQ